MKFAPVEDLLELSAEPVAGMGDEFGRVVAGAGGPSFFISVDNSDAAVEARVHQVDSPPALNEDDFEEVVEFSCVGPAVLSDPWATETHELVVIERPGPHRVRLACGSAGRRRELWELWVWPAEPEPGVVLLNPEAQVYFNYLDLPEAEVGLAAAARIGRDVDRAPGCRTLSGQTGTATASRVCRGPLAEHRLRFYGPHTWTRTPEGLAWLAQISGYPGWFPEDPDHPDQLVGRTGMLKTAPVTDRSVEDTRSRSKPPIVVKVNWYVSDTAPRAHLDPAEARPLLPEWTLQQTSFSRVKDPDGSSATLITVDHSGLPVEWVDDMRDWWTFQLAIQAQVVT